MTRKITITSSMMPVQAAVAQIASRLLPIIFALYQPHFVFSAACNNTFSSMFESLPTLHNCFTFGSVIAGDFPNLGASQIAAKLHYLDDESNTTANHVAWVLEGCLSKYCDTVPNCKESLRLQTLTKIHDGFNKSKYLAYKICENIPSTINSDVDGIGVSSVPTTRCTVLYLVETIADAMPDLLLSLLLSYQIHDTTHGSYSGNSRKS